MSRPTQGSFLHLIAQRLEDEPAPTVDELVGIKELVVEHLTHPALECLRTKHGNDMIEINLRLDVRDQSSTPEAIAQRQEQALALLGGVEHRRHDLLVNGVLVPRLVAAVEGWSESDLYDLAEQLGQDCIAAFDAGAGRGMLIGPGTEGYSPFDLASFQRLKMRAPTVDPAKGNERLRKLIGSKLPMVQDPTPPTDPKQ